MRPLLVLTALWALTRDAHADARSTVARMVFDNIDYAVRITITLMPDETTGGIVVRWQEGQTVVEKRFEREVRSALAKEWGSPSFAITHFPAERDCLGVEQRWELERAGERRTICKNQAALRRLGEVQALLQVLLR